ncbi:hypothetical protein CHS0354_020543 [Potamilus streckersoni]|uniref:Mab-21-like HhH/H2TH-like domain-containing protein n=1 Tax=Potamilus streckersoni TaxID=2493646 RepID=A0AAE0SNE2_9BIVA|nr:hypothetical protein CHS0354_020543 [Potamilus streckersoni]
MEIPDYYKDVSLTLMRVLDTAGLREDARWKRINMCLQCEGLQNMAFGAKCKMSVHVFGSKAEATTTMTLNADLDIIYYQKDISVLQDLQNWRHGPEIYLMIIDNTTPPGYVKLQAVLRNQPIAVCHVQNSYLMLDRYGQSVLRNFTNMYKITTADEYHGPATTIKFPSNLSIDNVIALRSFSWPYAVSGWITRQRQHNWPSRETVSIIQQSGALLVPVGHKESDYKHVEWRISLSYGEKVLVWQFNHTQYKCYVLLKMINKYFIKPKFGENAVTSYHWKTCMFWMIECTPAALWQPQNVLRCIDLCLREFCTWVEKGYYPNYFIPSENMFLGTVHGQIQRNLIYYLRHLFGQQGRYLTRIPYDGVGQKLIIACQSPITEIDDANEIPHFEVRWLKTYVWIAWFHLLKEGIQENPCIFKGIFPSHGVRQEIYTILMKFVCSSLGSHLASKCLEQKIIGQEGLDLAHEFLLLGLFSDVASGKLKLATFYLLQNNVILAEYILQNIAKNYTFLVSNVQTEDTTVHVMLSIINFNLSTTELIRDFSAFPVPYLPSEIHCTPEALIPEMFRSTGLYKDFSDPRSDLCQSWAVCYHMQNKIIHKMVALGNMIWVILHERLKYIDTALNLLAYCLKKDGFVAHSYIILYKSMKRKNHHNAAKWQMASLINAAFRLVGCSY